MNSAEQLSLASDMAAFVAGAINSDYNAMVDMPVALVNGRINFTIRERGADRDMASSSAVVNEEVPNGDVYLDLTAAILDAERAARDIFDSRARIDDGDEDDDDIQVDIDSFDDSL